MYLMKIIIIIMDGSYTAPIFLSRKLDALANTIHANIHIYKYNLRTHTHTHAHAHAHTHTLHGSPRFVETPVEKGKC